MARDPLDILLAKLNISNVQLKNTPLYEVIAELIKQVKLLRNESNSNGSGGGSSSVVNLTNIQQYIDVFGDGGGGEGEMGPPGIKGNDGAIGPTGAQGPPFPALIYLEPDLPEDVLPIPGPVGPTGATGATGAEGQRAIGFVLTEEADVEELPQMPPSNNSNPWIFIDSEVVAGATNYDFLGLGEYSEILVYINDVTRSNAVASALQVSEDGGATFLSTSGDYVAISTAGVETNATSIAFFSTGTTAARSGIVLVMGFNINGAPKVAQSASSNPNYSITSTNPFNAIRITVSAGTQNAGTIYVYGKK